MGKYWQSYWTSLIRYTLQWISSEQFKFTADFGICLKIQLLFFGLSSAPHYGGGSFCGTVETSREHSILSSIGILHVWKICQSYLNASISRCAGNSWIRNWSSLNLEDTLISRNGIFSLHQETQKKVTVVSSLMQHNFQNSVVPKQT